MRCVWMCVYVCICVCVGGRGGSLDEHRGWALAPSPAPHLRLDVTTRTTSGTIAKLCTDQLIDGVNSQSPQKLSRRRLHQAERDSSMVCRNACCCWFME